MKKKRLIFHKAFSWKSLEVGSTSETETSSSVAVVDIMGQISGQSQRRELNCDYNTVERESGRSLRERIGESSVNELIMEIALYRRHVQIMLLSSTNIVIS